MVLGTVSVIAAAGYYWLVLIKYPSNYPFVLCLSLLFLGISILSTPILPT